MAGEVVENSKSSKPRRIMGAFSGDVESIPEVSEVHEFTCGTDTAIYIPTKLTTVLRVNITPRTAASYAKTLCTDCAIESHAPSDTTTYGEAAVNCIKFVATAAATGSFIVEFVGTIQ